MRCGRSGLIPSSRAASASTRRACGRGLSLARAVLHNPELMLLDEPFSNVDVRSARDMAAVLGRVRDQGKTIFVVTHQAALMEDVADEFVHMAAGQIVKREQIAFANVVAADASARSSAHEHAEPSRERR